MAWNGKSFWAILVALCSLVSISACSAGADSTTTEVSGEVASTVDPTPTSGIYLADGEFVPFGEYDGVTTSRLMDPCADLPIEALQAIGFPGERQESMKGPKSYVCGPGEGGHPHERWEFFHVNTSVHSENIFAEEGFLLSSNASEEYPEIYTSSFAQEGLETECDANIDTVRGTLSVFLKSTNIETHQDTICNAAVELLEDLLDHTGENSAEDQP